MQKTISYFFSLVQLCLYVRPSLS